MSYRIIFSSQEDARVYALTDKSIVAPVQLHQVLAKSSVLVRADDLLDKEPEISVFKRDGKTCVLVQKDLGFVANRPVKLCVVFVVSEFCLKFADFDLTGNLHWAIKAAFAPSPKQQDELRLLAENYFKSKYRLL